MFEVAGLPSYIHNQGYDCIFLSPIEFECSNILVCTICGAAVNMEEGWKKIKRVGE